MVHYMRAWTLVAIHVHAIAGFRGRVCSQKGGVRRRRGEGGLQGWQGTRQLLIHSNISLPAIAYPEEGRGLLFVLF